jgi:hypothetical protein
MDTETCRFAMNIDFWSAWGEKLAFSGLLIDLSGGLFLGL